MYAIIFFSSLIINDNINKLVRISLIIINNKLVRVNGVFNSIVIIVQVNVALTQSPVDLIGRPIL